MTSGATDPRCVNCGHGDAEAVLLPIRFRGASEWICSQCFPKLIHKPETLAGRLEGAETLAPAEHDD